MRKEPQPEKWVLHERLKVDHEQPDGGDDSQGENVK